ncbi:putative WD repeat-containing protein [Escovopsis weberi]|uniref:Putative WD repeat-containing protein n=1 Tax=Escovopsis weberi TaxID=150374 RepID=A0A0M9VWQ2_ESCWE|nr:putative WD repeat-containing protein [Escovopsis weberi]
METTDTGKFFLTEAAHAENERKAAKSGNKNGNPIVMKSKILAVTVDPASPTDGVFIAESAGLVRRIKLSSAEPTRTYRGPKAPVTCVAVGGRGNGTVFAGSWDKDIWSWDAETGRAGVRFSGHGDFVKAVVCARVSGREVLVSGGADKKIMVWDAETGRRLHTLQDAATTMLAVQALAVDPVLSTGEAVVVASAGSDPHIRRWRISLAAAEQLAEAFADRPGAERPTIEEHRTSVYGMHYAADAGDADGEGGCDLYTTDADGLAKCLSRARGWVAEDVFEHGDYLRAVVATDAWVVTAGRDENVKVWDRASGALHCTLEGHYDEVTDLALMRDARGRPDRVCSVSIDGTIRTWPLARMELDELVRKFQEAGRPAATDDANPGGLLTAEEEAELAELMADDD